MRYPYGIWNQEFGVTFANPLQLWDIPMGFETQSCSRLWSWDLYYEISLWDLKLIIFGQATTISTLWDIPMGFETNKRDRCRDHRINYEISLWDLKLGILWRMMVRGELWDIPMGFETVACACVWWLYWIMRYPYGIWNNSTISVSKKEKPIMRYPYGIWNARRGVSVWAFRHYEISLWDLKRFCLSSLICSLIHYEISLWDLKPSISSLIDCFFSDYEISLWDLKLSNIALSDDIDIIMRYPYGIWNYTLYPPERPPKSSLWDIPMGFETGCFCGGTYFVQIMRYPYGIWNNRLQRERFYLQQNYEISLWDLKLV